MSRVRIALVVLLALVTAIPAAAQPQRFGLFFGDQPSDFFPERATCLTDRQIRDTVAALGYTNIYLNVPNDKRVQVRAVRDGWVYLLRFNYCTGRIEEREQLRPAG